MYHHRMHHYLYTYIDHHKTGAELSPSPCMYHPILCIIREAVYTLHDNTLQTFTPFLVSRQIDMLALIRYY